MWILLPTLALIGCAPAREPADLVLLGGKIVTMDAARPEVSALAARGGRIVAIGEDREIERLVGPSTEVVRLGGRLAVPGLIESHGHLVSLGRLRTNLDVTGTRSFEEIVARVREEAQRAKPGQWIFGRGWHQEKWDRRPDVLVEGFPTHDALTEASPHNPVLLRHSSGHAAVANAAALEAAGITSVTKDPPGGRILHDRSGRPTGVLIENAEDAVAEAMEKARAGRPRKEIDEEGRRLIELAQEECLSKGITTFQDAGSSFETIDRMKQMAVQGRLRMRLWVMTNEPNSKLRERLSHYRLLGLGNGFLTVRAIKRQIDGAMGSRGAWLLEPYSDDPTTSGLSTLAMADLEETARLAIENGFQLAIHAIGDRANREVLDLYERTFAAHPEKKDLRWRIEHAQNVDPFDVPRFARLGVIASMQGIHCTSDGPWVVARLGAERAREEAYVWRKLLDSGALICNGTDTPVEDVDPIANFHASVTRSLADGSQFFPEQRMTREEALRSYTSSAAHAAFQENAVGTLAPGKLADVTVLSRDILTVPDEEIVGTRVLYTIVGGKVAFRSPDGS